MPVHIEQVVGREAGGDVSLAIEDRALSRRHARFVRRGQRIEVEDLGSTNGTFVNGKRLGTTALALEAHSVVRLGETLLCAETLHLGSENAPPPPPFVGTSAVMRRVYAELHRIATSSASVLVLGSSGSGKELAAQALHTLSGRSGAFVAVNCSAINPSVAESLLFGHHKGAFTGAHSQVQGYFEQADGGTLFLDEVSELEIALQAKLLRALESGQIHPVGGPPATVDVRVVSATNVELSERVRDERFRADLYARVAAMTVRMPPLDDHKADLPSLFRSFADKDADTQLLEALMLRAWPLGVRELRNVAQRVAIEAGAEPILRLAHLPDELRVASIAVATSSSRDISQEQVEQALRQAHGNIAAAARVLGKDRKQIYRLLETYGLDAETFR